MKCPHCLTDFHDNPGLISLGVDADGGWMVIRRQCPACGKFVIHLETGSPVNNSQGQLVRLNNSTSVLIRPKGSARPPCPSEVPKEFRDDYSEACVVLPDSPKAAAALGRRCLQHLLREVAKVKPGNLADEIQQVIDSGKLPSHLVDSIDAIRNIGNFAAHPLKSRQSGEILEVEPGEAEWNLDVLESFFDFYFVQPALIKKKRDALNQKLQQAGKPAMK